MKWVLVVLAVNPSGYDGEAKYYRVPGWTSKETCQAEAKKYWPHAICYVDATTLPTPK